MVPLMCGHLLICRMAQELYSSILDYKHKNLTDETLPGFLANQVKSDLDVASKAGRLFIDLSFNRFTVSGLDCVINLMETHPQARKHEQCHKLQNDTLTLLGINSLGGRLRWLEPLSFL